MIGDERTGSHAPQSVSFSFFTTLLLLGQPPLYRDQIFKERKKNNNKSENYCHIHAAHTDNENYLSRALERLGTTALSKDQEAEIGAAFIKFAVVTKELSALLRTLVR